MGTEDLAFARKASGLVRGLSTFDAFGMGLLLINCIYPIWYAIEVGLGLYPRANLLIALLISLVLGGISGVIVWGVLGGSMPRSGGEYVYNSRILHPVVAMGASFAAVVALMYWNIFIATMVADPTLAMIGQYLGWDGLASFVTSKGGMFTVATLATITSVLIIAFGVKFYTRFQKPIVVITFGGPLVLSLIILFTSKSTFIEHWNAAAQKYGSLTYNGFTEAVGTAAGTSMPTTWNWSDTFGGMVALMVIFIYLYTVSYVGGEVKRPEKSILKANFLIIIVPTIVAALAFIGLYKMVDFGFLSAVGYNNLNGPVEGYNLPWPSTFMTLVFIASGNNWFVGLLAALSFGLANWMLIGIDIMLMQRAMFAWGMDRRGPKWFTDISGRWASPIKMYVLLAAIMIVAIAWYVFSGGSSLAGLIGAGLQLISVFLITGISALIFAYRRKVRTIWDASPYSQWRVGPVSVLSIAAVFYLGYLAVAFYFAFLDPQTRDVTGKNVIFFAVVWALGIAWYYAWRYVSSRAGVDSSVTYGELPPE